MADFTWTPNWVRPQKPTFPVLVTEAESGKKQRGLLDTAAARTYRLSFEGVSDAVRNAIKDHYEAQYGEYSKFSWTTVPSYINEGSSMDVYYVDYDEDPLANGWDIDIVFEKDI